MSFESLTIHYGYPLLFAGTVFEGETFLLIGAFLAHRGYLNLPLVMLTCFLASFATDQGWFLVGRNRGSAFAARRPRWQRRLQRVQKLLDKYGLLLIIGFRFAWGLRIATPFVIGASGFSRRRFLLLNLIGGLVWALVIGLAGYVFGHALELLLADLRRYELWIVLALLSGGTAVWLWCIVWRNCRSTEPDAV
ncbi:MAG TPA: DedA family protein [Blastocatellia bacterium]|nr:DedA family protein [Blastocatellia bacterium]